MSAPVRAPALRFLDRSVRRLLTGVQPAGPAVEDALRVTAEVVAGGRPVAVRHVPGGSADAPAEWGELIARVHAAGLATFVELTLPAGRLGAEVAARLGRTAQDTGLAVALEGAAHEVHPVSAVLPGAAVVVPAGEPDAERRCRGLAEGRVRLVRSRGAGADLAFVRCLNILMAAGGRPEVATTDRRLIAIAGERAAWNGRSPDSWEHVMPYGVRTEDQQRLTAAGYTVRIEVLSGPAAFLGHRW